MFPVVIAILSRTGSLEALAAIVRGPARRTGPLDFWGPERDEIGACLLDDLDLEAVVAQGSGRTWLVLVAPETCWSTERVLEAIDRSERPVERIDLDGPSTLLLVK